MVTKFICSLSLLIASTSANAVLVDGKFTARVYLDESDAGVWSKNMVGSDVTGQFWYDTDLAPAPNLDFPPISDYDSYTNSWVNFTYFVDGRIIDVSKLEGYTNVQPREFVVINPEVNMFRVDDGIVEGDFFGDYAYRGGSLWVYESTDMIKDGNLEQNFS